MRKHLERYVVELLIIFLGALSPALEAILGKNIDTALILASISVLIALAVAAIRQEITSQVGEVLLERHILDAIPDRRWRKDAEDEIEAAWVKFNSWGGGTR